MTNKSFLFWMDQGDQPSSVIAMKLGNTTEPFIVRLTGGCGFMNQADGTRSIRILTKALTGFKGILLYGGTRVFCPTKDTKSGYRVFPTILEVPPKLRRINPGMLSFGIIPKMTHVEYSRLGLIIAKDPETGFLTVIHPNQDLCLVLQKNVDQMSFWDAEWIECLSIIKEFLAHRTKFGTVLVAYNGGEVTGHEIDAWAEEGLPVILVAGSGRKTDEYCQNLAWLQKHPSVSVCQNPQEIRQKISSLGGL
ncbi:MAG: hypothetical protein UX47_C0002G0001 [Candidatus Collierbacteria bacterium GW2011_GWA2_46_26]|uniref:Uncharacterized protein n=1 Tax=Candidatus Collierbacteria bacterium GW2011_GWA2_46_26 TaxID=1618381 RepID=A0A0G1RUG7_9BACT|nr:MAG: hypothetical protein UW29_C0001G0001 [Candidatus Collierbacteria bacterium GW2011_GWC2_44_13]KKU33593.1 MAG: hypothetical protein UX47_C0002G0001 [Candidatus Collierbacteria bacterium GW2011_GWA2_46_26]